MKGIGTSSGSEEEGRDTYRRQERQKRQRSKRFIMLAIVVLLALLAGGLVALFESQHNSTSRTGDPQGPAIIGLQVVNQVTKVVPAEQTSVSGSGLYLLTQLSTSGPFNLNKIDPKTKRLLWMQNISDPIVKVTAANGVVYATGQEGAEGIKNPEYVYAFDARNGMLFWKANLGSDVEPGTFTSLSRISSPTIMNGTVYATAVDGALVALNARDGSKQWMYDAHTTTLHVLSASSSVSYQTDPVTVVNGIIYGGIHNKLFAVNAANGKELWSKTVKSTQMLRSPLVLDGVVYIDSFQEQLTNGPSQQPGPDYIYAFDAKSGKLLWSKQTSSDFSPPVIANGMVYVHIGAGDNSIHALDVRNGREVRKINGFNGNNFNRFNGNEVQVLDGTLYASKSFSDDNGVIAINADNGSVRWHHEEKNMSTVKLDAVSNGIVYADTLSPGQGGSLYAFKSNDGSKLWQYDYNSSSTSILAMVP